MIILVANKSRAEYFRERRKTRKQFNVMIENELFIEIDNHLKRINKTRTEWFKEVVKKELGLK